MGLGEIIRRIEEESAGEADRVLGAARREAAEMPALTRLSYARPT